MVFESEGAMAKAEAGAEFVAPFMGGKEEI